MNQPMKAIVCEEYGPPDVLHLREVERPEYGDGDVLIKVIATTVTRYDCWARSASAHTGFGWIMRFWFGIERPKKQILGTELAGVVEAVGSNVSRLKAGDPVYAYSGINLGAYAEYITLPENAVAHKPKNISFKEAASVLQGGLTALYFLRKANIGPGQKILIIGASGGIGLNAVMLAKGLFNGKVTGVCSTDKMRLVKLAGADVVIDYTTTDYSRTGDRYDVIFDTFGISSFSAIKMLKKKGKFLYSTFGAKQLLPIIWLNVAIGKKAISPLLKETIDDLLFIKKLIEEETIVPILDKTYPMDQAADAHRYVEEGKKKGGVVITIS